MFTHQNNKHRSAPSSDQKVGVDVPIGYKFQPEAHELIEYFLWPKVLNQPTPMYIPEVQIYNTNTRNHPEILLGGMDPIVGEPYEKEWYFYTEIGKKYAGGKKNTARVSGNGCWKASGKDRLPIRNMSGEVIGMKKALTYHIGQKRVGDWIMYEHKLANSPAADNNNTDKKIVLCRIHSSKNASTSKKDQELDEEAAVVNNVDQIASSVEEARIFEEKVWFNEEMVLLNDLVIAAERKRELEQGLVSLQRLLDEELDEDADVEKYVKDLENEIFAQPQISQEFQNLPPANGSIPEDDRVVPDQEEEEDIINWEINDDISDVFPCLFDDHYQDGKEQTTDMMLSSLFDNVEDDIPTTTDNHQQNKRNRDHHHEDYEDLLQSRPTKSARK